MKKLKKVKAAAKPARVKPKRTAWPNVRGSSHPSSKFTNHQRIAIIKAYDKGTTQGSMAKKFKVSQACISHIVRNQRWLLEEAA